MVHPDQLTALYHDVLENRLGFDVKLRDGGSLAIRTLDDVEIVVRHFAPSMPEFVELAAYFGLAEEAPNPAAAIEAVNLRMRGAVLMSLPTPNRYVASVQVLVAAPDMPVTSKQLCAVLPRGIRTVHGSISDLLEELDRNSGDAA